MEGSCGGGGLPGLPARDASIVLAKRAPATAAGVCRGSREAAPPDLGLKAGSRIDGIERFVPTPGAGSRTAWMMYRALVSLDGSGPARR